MADKDTGEDPMKKTIIVVLTFVFVALYVGALMEWNNLAAKMALIQPTVYVIIGYFFGRMPSEKNEKTLREDAKDKEQKADVATANAVQATSKLRAVKHILSEDVAASGIAPTLGGSAMAPVVLQERVKSALKAIDD